MSLNKRLASICWASGFAVIMGKHQMADIPFAFRTWLRLCTFYLPTLLIATCLLGLVQGTYRAVVIIINKVKTRLTFHSFSTHLPLYVPAEDR